MMEQIKLLREKTGAGMSDCKKALDETNGDIDKAIEFLRKQGIAKAVKRSEREASQGIIKVTVNENKKEGYIIEVNSETDFVARNEQFQEFVSNVIELIKNNHPENMEALLDLVMSDGHSIKDSLETLSGVIGEKLAIKRYEILKTNGTCAAYSHMNGNIGVLVALDKEDDELAQNLAMQIAAANPKYISPEEVPVSETDKEKEIYREQLKKEGKAEEMMDRILVGKVNKYYEEVCLLKQEYVKDDSKKIENILNGATIEKFFRYSL